MDQATLFACVPHAKYAKSPAYYAGRQAQDKATCRRQPNAEDKPSRNHMYGKIQRQLCRHLSQDEAPLLPSHAVGEDQAAHAPCLSDPFDDDGIFEVGSQADSLSYIYTPGRVLDFSSFKQ